MYYTQIFRLTSAVHMGESRKTFRGVSQIRILGIKVAQFNVLLELQLRSSLVISQIPV